MNKAPYGTCSDCRFYTGHSMQCRRHAPQGNIAPDKTDCASYGSNWPSSDTKDWCGEWMPLTDIQLSSTYGENVVSNPNDRVIIVDPYTEVPVGSSIEFIGSGGYGGGSGGGGCNPRFGGVGITILAEPTKPTAD